MIITRNAVEADRQVAHLGVESQRQWSDLAIARTTPALLGLFSLTTLMADRAAQRDTLPVRRTAWYAKPTPTFSDATAVVRSQMWRHLYFQMSPAAADVQRTPSETLTRFTDAFCYAT